MIVAGRDGEMLTEIHQEATRTWPPGAGDTVLGRVVAPDPELSRGIARLVAELGWQGLAQIEFFRAPDGTVAITDFNGRFYGSMALAIAAGVNVPAIWARDALGLDPWEGGTRREARLGARFQWLNRDLAAGYAQGPAGLVDALARGAAVGALDVECARSAAGLPLPAARGRAPAAGEGSGWVAPRSAAPRSASPRPNGAFLMVQVDSDEYDRRR